MMMKVKPFSYHIPPRRKSDDISTTSLFSTTKSTPFSVAASYFSPSCSSDNNRRRRQRNSSSIISLHCASSNFLFYGDVGSVLILVLLGFIGVAGQGKLSEMHDSSEGTLPNRVLLPETSLSHKSLNSFPGIGVLHNDHENNDDDYDVLQQRISSMGQFGVKYRNSSYNYNYSSFPPHHHHDYHRSRQYKLEPNFGTGITSSPRENLMLSLQEDVHYEQSTSSNNNSDIDENSINFQSIPKFQRNQIDNAIREDDDKAILNYADKQSYPVIREPQTPNHTSSITRSHQDRFTNTKLHYRSTKGRPGSQRTEEDDQYDVINVDGYNKKEKAQRQEKPSIRLPFSQRENGERYPTSQLDEYDDEDVIEKFIPGNNSHTSGKFRFKQSSQAEVDGNENDNSLRSRRRPRRSVVHLYDMVVCSTGCNPLIFKGYGCYCGFLGSGLTVDGIDKCCAKHDWCYHHAKCPPLLTYFVPYYWRCDHGRPQCVTDFRGWKGICGAHLCECDRQFAECLKKFPCPRSRAMCVTSPWSHHTPAPADPRALPFTVSTPPRPWRPPPPLPFPPPPRIPFLPFPPMGRLFP